MRLKGLNVLTGPMFKRVKLSSSSFVSSTVVLLVSRSCSFSGLPYVGFIVTKKNGSAVKRNFLKRRLRSVAVKVIAEFADKSNAYILIPRFSLLNSTFRDLERDILYCLKNAKSKR